MGLGKTVQAIAACELLRRIQDIQRVLVISPASLKGEWEEQIAKFTNLPSRIIQGARAKRLHQYGKAGLFYLANYEQIRMDVEEINNTSHRFRILQQPSTEAPYSCHSTE